MDWPSPTGVQFTETAGAVTSTSLGTAITASATVNTKGSYSELIASTARDAVGFWVYASWAGSTPESCLLDIAVGAGGSEQIIVPDLLIPRISGAGPGEIFIPIAVPAGSRLSARSQATLASIAVSALLILESGSFREGPPLSRVTAYGVATGDSGATSIDPGGTANTKGSYTEITSSTTGEIQALIIGIGNQANATRSTQTWLVDIAIGAAGSEQVIIADLLLRATSGGDDVDPALLGPFYVPIPAGSRLSARAQSSGIDATDRLFDLAIYGVC